MASSSNTPRARRETSATDFAPTATWETLCRRAQWLKRLRSFFDEQGFVEVETPLLSADTVVDRHLDPIPVTLFTDPREPEVGDRFFLQTSPEFGMKRLLVSGATAIYQVTRAFRGGERGRLHNPEFTMVEWYRVGDDYAAGRQLLAELAQRLLLVPAVESLTYADAFRRYVQLDPTEASNEALVQRAQQLGGPLPDLPLDDRDAWLNWLLAQWVEPQLGREHPTILYDYPASQAALAAIDLGPPAVAQRFELYVNGIELANGYHELLDADALAERARVVNRERQLDGKYVLPEASRLEAAMRVGLPPCSGVALGFDRLLMVAWGAQSIDEVLAFPIERA
ncbi:MAG: EF-P lysine aminoacylase EpmA [Planctomycetota bacterium]